ncbi:MAG: hypothetical protein COT91_04550 [Candidatus Doudnabacteria bacterium CG10_big_fil_rev_8_21_14_0_10_41_10]|uniref:Uncharacterized protein n=1 Tax=Candidatus Doudnabacteria bacterium CG10_big_fil_rev_8_21_14_0_10_41_10 TaxID=1974551 RepID=A0A2H0VCN4_9BACT|nr:MAG: hypothetical protein COT91_04550 [Candidatus Doudnabacteria bacterium CG10_big_fil_rev_8_21_14_0_10_41_10]
MKPKKRTINILVSCTLIFVFALSVPLYTLAIDLSDAENLASEINITTNHQTFGDVLLATLKGLLAMAFLAALIFIIFSGYQFTASQGDEKKLAKAKKV